MEEEGTLVREAIETRKIVPLPVNRRRRCSGVDTWREVLARRSSLLEHKITESINLSACATKSYHLEDLISSTDNSTIISKRQRAGYA